MKKPKSQQKDYPARRNNDNQLPDTALLSEKVLARDWLKPEEEEAWNYL